MYVFWLETELGYTVLNSEGKILHVNITVPVTFVPKGFVVTEDSQGNIHMVLEKEIHRWAIELYYKTTAFTGGLNFTYGDLDLEPDKEEKRINTSVIAEYVAVIIVTAVLLVFLIKYTARKIQGKR
jgi:hypothetical protein